ncbi:MAG: hypothetical protein Q7S00_02120, partial [bacterium]|nr:hypothetical protein [bacterium]
MAVRQFLAKITPREKKDSRLFQTSVSLLSSSGSSETYIPSLEAFRRLFNAAGASLLLKDETAKQFVMRAAVCQRPLSYCLAFDHPFLEKLFRWGRPLRRE